MKKFYLHNGTSPQGPYNLDDLKLKHLTRETPVWYEGIDDWTLAGQVAELRNVLSNISPPPYKSARAVPIPPKQNKRGYLRILICIGAIIITLLVTLIVIRNIAGITEPVAVQSPKTYRQKVQTVEETERLMPARFLKAEGDHFHNIWGKIKVRGTIQNTATTVSYKNAVIRITLFDKDKKKLGSEEYTINDSFPPSSTVNFVLKMENDQPVKELKYEIIKAGTY